MDALKPKTETMKTKTVRLYTEPRLAKPLATGRIKTIDLEQLDWFDRVNGNTYFAARVTVNYGMKSERSFVLPFQYGYGSHCEGEASKCFDWKSEDHPRSLGHECREAGIIFRHTRRNALKRELNNL